MSQRFYWLIVLLGGLTSGSLVLLTSAWGVGTTADSVQYILSARQLLQGHSISDLPVHWPPLYPMLIAVPGLFGLDPIDSLRWVHAGIAAAATFVFGCLLRPGDAAAPLAGVLVVLLFALHPGLYSVFYMAWSEPLFILLVLTHFLSLREFLSRHSPVFLLAGGLCVGAAILTRYAGVAFAAASLAFIVFRRDIDLKVRWGQVTVYALGAVLPS